MELDRGVWIVTNVNRTEECNESAMGTYTNDESSIRSLTRKILVNCGDQNWISANFLSNFQNFKVEAKDSGDELHIIDTSYISQNVCTQDGRIHTIYKRLQFM